MFKTELHCHSDDISMCARVSVNDIIEKFHGAGYSSLVLTNHFNKDTMNAHSPNDWCGFIDKYVAAYEKLKKAAEGKLNIILGMELRFNANINDYLVFGITEKFLKKNEGMFDMSLKDFRRIANENGCLVVQAHPFRFGMTVTDPANLDGVEVRNGHMGHNSNNDIAKAWAEKYSLIQTSGTDFHYKDVPANSGIMTDEEIVSSEQLVSILKSGNYTLIEE